MKLSHYFAGLRHDRKMTMDELAAKAGCNKTIVWRVEHGKGVKADTMKRLITYGLGIKPSDPDYNLLMALWNSTKTGIPLDGEDIEKAIASAKVKNNDEFAPFAKKLLTVASKIDTSIWPEVLRALERPEVIAALPALNRIHEGKK